MRGKLARTVWSGGKFGDNFKELPITIYKCDSFLNKAFVVEGQNQALTKERKFQMLGELTIQEVE